MCDVVLTFTLTHWRQVSSHFFTKSGRVRENWGPGGRYALFSLLVMGHGPRTPCGARSEAKRATPGYGEIGIMSFCLIMSNLPTVCSQWQEIPRTGARAPFARMRMCLACSALPHGVTSVSAFGAVVVGARCCALRPSLATSTLGTECVPRLRGVAGTGPRSKSTVPPPRTIRLLRRAGRARGGRRSGTGRTSRARGDSGGPTVPRPTTRPACAR
jgi:hypothetical protein